MKNNKTKDLSSCITQRFIGKLKNNKNLGKNLSEIENKIIQSILPVNIIFESVKHNVIKIKCYFSAEMCLVHRTTYQEDGSIKQTKAF